MPEPEIGLPLAHVINELRDQIVAAAQIAANAEVRFIPESIEIELHVVVAETTRGSGKASFWILTLGGEASEEVSRSHRVKITLRPVGKNGRLLIASNADGWK